MSGILILNGFDVWLSTSSKLKNEDSQSDISVDLSQKLPESDLYSPNVNSDYMDQHKKNHIFQDKANEAGCIIILLSRKFAESSTSKTQVYYCEHRKRLIPIICDEFEMPVWVTRLVNSRLFIRAEETELFAKTLKTNVLNALRNSTRYLWADDFAEEEICFQAVQLKKLMPEGYTIYITGYTEVDDETRDICR